VDVRSQLRERAFDPVDEAALPLDLDVEEIVILGPHVPGLDEGSLELADARLHALALAQERVAEVHRQAHDLAARVTLTQEPVGEHPPTVEIIEVGPRGVLELEAALGRRGHIASIDERRTPDKPRGPSELDPLDHRFRGFQRYRISAK